MKVGIVGLPNAGKSSLFNLLTNAQAKVECYPFTTIEKNVGVVTVPDDRLDNIGRLLKPEKLTPAHVDFVDIAGLVKGASKGEGLGNKFLAHIRESDLILHLVRSFCSPDVPHVFDTIDPDRDAEIVESELALADLAVVERRLEHVRKEPRSIEHDHLLSALDKLSASLAGGFVRPGLASDEMAAIRSMNLFVVKPLLYAVNCSDCEPAEPGRFPKLAAGNAVLFSSALEQAMCEFTEAEKAELRAGLGLAPEGPQELVNRGFAGLDLIRFYTVKGVESRAWSAPRGITALEAAAMIHSDLAAGFIKAEVVNYDDLAQAGDFHAARDAGKVKVEGRNYVVADGDVLLVKFRG